MKGLSLPVVCVSWISLCATYPLFGQPSDLQDICTDGSIKALSRGAYLLQQDNGPATDGLFPDKPRQDCISIQDARAQSDKPFLTLLIGKTNACTTGEEFVMPYAVSPSSYATIIAYIGAFRKEKPTIPYRDHVFKVFYPYKNKLVERYIASRDARAFIEGLATITAQAKENKDLSAYLAGVARRVSSY
ncbi:hypothetical protein [Hymenobacter sp. HDW8]|uniref:hypothetical protein n=1 Tax=Hymenobacter sp. HDW8 TaxID=2714932 RepID=UPI001407E8F9|nr:hypothetical protein [Hymenobacter sp. HDW8]QIL78363.1 hypothetical protein G7064_21345 [Hymenobacter sp. HDW8]